MSQSIQAVLLDMYGTLAYIPTDEYLSAKQSMAKIVGCDTSRFLEAWRSFTTASVSGTLVSVKDRVQATLSKLQIEGSAAQIDEMTNLEVALQKQKVRLFSGTLSTLSRLKALPLRLALVTNAPSISRQIPALLGIADYFDSMVFSFEVHLVKPDPQIYILATQRLDVEASSCLFAGDGDAQELDGALKVGMVAVMVKGAETLTLHSGSSTQFTYAIERIDQLPDLVERLLGVGGAPL